MLEIVNTFLICTCLAVLLIRRRPLLSSGNTRGPSAPLPAWRSGDSPELALALAAIGAALGRAAQSAPFEQALSDVQALLEAWKARAGATKHYGTPEEVEKIVPSHPDYAFALQVITWAREMG